jgi:hypothetical protein
MPEYVVEIICNRAFVGVLPDSFQFPENIPDESRSLIGRTFLAAPLLQAVDCQEIKVSGNEDFDEHDSEIGRVLYAFTHHVYEETEGKLIPADLQGMTSVILWFYGLRIVRYARIYVRRRRVYLI